MIVGYLLIALFALVDIWLAVCMVEYMYCVFVMHQLPFVPANKKMRRVVVMDIMEHYAGAKNIVEIGSGHCGLARYIARRTGANVFAIENMSWSAFVSKCLDVFCRARCRTVRADAFEWLAQTNVHMDIAVAFLGPRVTPRLAGLSDKFDVLMSLDFEIPGVRPVRTIDIGSGCTLYAGKKYPHRLYVYEFRR